ncbi:MAG TPA: ketopantoate reductase family protein [Nitrolancea sp.]|nr:ketopantoate reductase family protein [Nitrolancea sp.]
MAADSPASPTFLVYGAGAVGSLLGARLTLSGQKVTLLGRPATRRMIAEHGLRIEQPDGPTVVRPPVITRLAELPTPPDIVLLAIKAYSLAESIPDIEQLAAGGATIVALQNGVGTEERLIETRVIKRLIAASLTISVGSSGEGTVRQETSHGGLALASVNDSGSAITALQQACEASGIRVALLPDYRQMKWSKLLLNILANATSAILATEPGAIFADRSLFRLEQRAFIEALVVMAAQGMSPVGLPGFNVPMLVHAMRLPAWASQRLIAPRIAGGRGDKRPSLWIDIDSQRGQTEIDWLNGAVAAAARRLSIPTPINAALTRLLNEIATNPTRRAELASHPRLLLDEVYQSV